MFSENTKKATLGGVTLENDNFIGKQVAFEVWVRYTSGGGHNTLGCTQYRQKIISSGRGIQTLNDRSSPMAQKNLVTL
jgi:hypothetical protein